MATEKRLIDAKAGKKRFCAIAKPAEYNGVIHLVVPISEIDKLPTVDAVEVVRARWVDNHCTACGMMPMGEELWKHMDIAPPRMECFMDYCPCCGAKMYRG